MGLHNLIRTETCLPLLGLYNRLRPKTYNNSCSLIAEFLTDDALAAIGGSKVGEDVLLWASHKLEQNSRYLFWERILCNRGRFSDAFIASIWYEVFTDYSNAHCQHLLERDGTVSDFGWRDLNPAELAESVITSSNLLDSPAVIQRYCQARKHGWETLRYLGAGRQWNTLPGWKNVRQDIHDDCVAGFAMERTMLGNTLSFSIIAEILECGAWKIFRHLLEHELEVIDKLFPLEEIACHAVAQFSDSRAVAALEILEDARPGLTGQFRDALGHNLLWYGMHNLRSCWFHPDSKLTAFLTEHGCSPELPTHIGLSCRFLTDSLTDKNKALIWRKRRSVNKHLAAEQPNLWGKA